MKALKHRIILALLALQAVLVVTGLTLCLPPLFRQGMRTVSAWRAKSMWVATMRDEAPNPVPGKPCLWLQIADCSIDTLVLFDDTPRNLQRAPCMRSIGDMRVITAHRDTHFRGLANLRNGMRMTLTNPDGGVQTYRIAETEIVSQEGLVNRLRGERGKEWVALVTCHPFRYIGAAPDRFIAWAESIETRAPAAGADLADHRAGAAGRG